MGVIRWTAAGATGIVAMELVSYLDMLVRGRPASDQPERLGERLAARLGVAEEEGGAAKARRRAIGALAGYPDGLLLPLLVGLLGAGRRPFGAHVATLTLGALIGSSALPSALGVTDVRDWSANDWITDMAPHLAYGIAAALVSRRG